MTIVVGQLLVDFVQREMSYQTRSIEARLQIASIGLD